MLCLSCAALLTRNQQKERVRYQKAIKKSLLVDKMLSRSAKAAGVGSACWKTTLEFRQIDDIRWSRPAYQGCFRCMRCVLEGFLGETPGQLHACSIPPHDAEFRTTDYRAFARIYPRFSNKRAARWPQEGLRSGLRESCERSCGTGRKGATKRVARGPRAGCKREGVVTSIGHHAI